MARRRNLKSISTPIIMGAVSVPLSVALLVGWTLIIARNLARVDDATLDTWLLIAGALSFFVIVTVLVLLSFYLAREILEVRRQDSFIDSVTHELRSPLASIRLGLETLGRKELPVEKGETLREMMLADVERLSAFIDDLLHASRLSSLGETSLNIGEVELAPAIREICDVAIKRWRIAPEVFTIDIEASLVLTTDAPALAVVMRNLVDNAIKYGGEKPTVAIRAARSDNGLVTIEVQDQGIGLEAQHLKRVFHRFFRVTSTDVRERHGTGLGLFVVGALMRSLGGRASAQSPGLGKGTTIRLELPAESDMVSS